MTGYEPVFNETALRALLIEKRSERIRILALINNLAENPRPADFLEQSARGREVDVFVCEEWMITVWRDHAVKELRVVNIERV